jgi:hypothetical protein
MDAEARWDPIKQFTITRKRLWKLINYFWILFIIVLMIMGILFVKNIFFPPVPSNENKPEIHVATGGTLHYTNVQESHKKRSWWIPTPFVEAFGEMKTDKKEPAFGARVGARWEF